MYNNYKQNNLKRGKDMSFIEVKCKNCGATLSINNDKLVCRFCGTKYIYNNQLNTDFQIRAGVLEKYIGANVNAIIPKSATHIGQGAFKDCIGLKNIYLHDQIISIGDNAFENCKNLTTIIIPKSVSIIGKNVFLNCDNLSKITTQKNYNINTFMGSKYFKEIQKKNNRCQYCGGEFMGLFKKACQKCGKWKDY